MGTGRSWNGWRSHLTMVVGCLTGLVAVIWWGRAPAPDLVPKHSSPQFDTAISSLEKEPRRAPAPDLVPKHSGPQFDTAISSLEEPRRGASSASSGFLETKEPEEAPPPEAESTTAALGSLQPCKASYRDPSSRPGRPCLPQVSEWPYKSNTASRTQLGERAWMAATGKVAEVECGGWHLFGDMTWCKRALSSTAGSEQKDGAVIGLSYGIEQRDLWSEIVSNDYKVPTRLYDCFQNPKDSPPLGREDLQKASCAGAPGHCYETRYQSHRICLGGAGADIPGQRKYESLRLHLKDRQRLSVHLKIDTEGSEWEELEWLLSSPKDLDKIRTLDMEVHLGWRVESTSESRKRLSNEARIARDIETLERLGQYFRCTGSSMEVLAEEWMGQPNGGRCKPQSCGEPLAHTATGFPVIQFAISWVHPALLASAPMALAPNTKPKPAPKPALSGPPAPAALSGPESPPTWSCKRSFTDASSRPGRPCLPTPAEWPYKTKLKSPAKLGERAVAAAMGEVTEKQCHKWHLFGDMTWCMKAFSHSDPSALIGLSYGIEQRDLWSERVSQLFKIRTRLYDCYQRPEDSTPLGGRAINASGACTEEGPPCYEAPYEPYTICLGPESRLLESRRFESLQLHLRNRKRLSVHLKIDVEGSEWEVLEWLLSSPEIDKIRTLDMEVHLGFLSGSGKDFARSSMKSKDRIAYDIDILERLRQVLTCTGSSLEVLAEGWMNDGEGGKCGGRCQQPEAHAAGGFPMTQFAISLEFRPPTTCEAVPF
ncbi:unnamed protein product [Effrenium voratum]|uniref:Methyltransferase domain-containing protein n=1 Tax=Effrenium voratum TaxID=2562239 RepID=A0AA36NGB4_9DINO|nr:unnamed protein product [Effrenium voratum]CAJ1430411.1 unnamed protein product [Effrenium voratum]